MKAPCNTGPGEQLTRRAFIQSGTLWLLGAAVAAPCGEPTVEVRESTVPLVRIGLVTDLHYADRPPAGTRFYRETLPKLRECVTRFNEIRPDFAVELGDFVDAAETAAEEIEFLKTIETEYARLNCERHYVLGNHCVWTLTKEQFLDNCAARKPFYSFDHGSLHFIVLDACFRADGVAYGGRNFTWTDTEIPPAERAWLQDDLNVAKGKVIVFVHQRLDVQGDYGVKSAPAVRAILEQSGKVLAVFQGHYHQNDYRQIKGIHYCTLAAMIEGSGADNNAYALLSVFKDGTLTVDGFRRQKSHRFRGPG